jgi:hypothetical protein
MKMKISTTMQTWEKINITKQVDKKVRSGVESNTTNMTKWQELLHVS